MLSRVVARLRGEFPGLRLLVGPQRIELAARPRPSPTSADGGGGGRGRGPGSPHAGRRPRGSRPKRLPPGARSSSMPARAPSPIFPKGSIARDRPRPLRGSRARGRRSVTCSAMPTSGDPRTPRRRGSSSRRRSRSPRPRRSLAFLTGSCRGRRRILAGAIATPGPARTTLLGFLAGGGRRASGAPWGSPTLDLGLPPLFEPPPPGVAMKRARPLRGHPRLQRGGAPAPDARRASTPTCGASRSRPRDRRGGRRVDGRHRRAGARRRAALPHRAAPRAQPRQGLRGAPGDAGRPRGACGS